MLDMSKVPVKPAVVKAGTNVGSGVVFNVYIRFMGFTSQEITYPVLGFAYSNEGMLSLRYPSGDSIHINLSQIYSVRIPAGVGPQPPSPQPPSPLVPLAVK